MESAPSSSSPAWLRRCRRVRMAAGRVALPEWRAALARPAACSACSAFCCCCCCSCFWRFGDGCHDVSHGAEDAVAGASGGRIALCEAVGAADDRIPAAGACRRHTGVDHRRRCGIATSRLRFDGELLRHLLAAGRPRKGSRRSGRSRLRGWDVRAFFDMPVAHRAHASRGRVDVSSSWRSCGATMARLVFRIISLEASSEMSTAMASSRNSRRMRWCCRHARWYGR